MIFVIPNIYRDILDNSDGNHMKQVNVFIKTLFHVISDDETNFTPEKFWSEYTEINQNNGPFGGYEFILRSKYTHNDEAFSTVY